MTMKTLGLAATMLCGALLTALPSAAGAQTIERKAGVGQAPISAAVSVPASANVVYLSGSVASPLDPAKPDELGDTKAQTLSILTKMKAQLEGMGYTMGDVVKMTVFLVGTPANGGKMDAPGMNEVFRTFFGSADQPNKPARSTVQVAALGRPSILVEIEAVVAKMP